MLCGTDVILKDQTQLFNFSRLFFSAYGNIDPCRVDVRMSQQIGQSAQVFFRLIKHAREQMPQIVGKHLAAIHPRHLAQILHFM